MERFSGQDAIFLSMERPTWHQHTGGLLIFDASEAPSFSFESFQRLVAERLPLAPRFVCRVKEVPFGLDRPLWVKDRNFDVANHMHRVALPSPGGLRELAELVGDMMGHQLDRRMPLWEMWFIEGLEDGHVAVLAKTHHCMMDGASGQGLAEYLFDLEANPSSPPPVPPEVDDRSEDRLPGDLELVARGLIPTLTAPLTMSRYGLQLARRGLSVLPFLRGQNKPATPMDAPPTPWNASLSPRRRLSFVSVPLDDVKAVRQHFDVKINDVVLALVTTAMRRYLIEQDALPDKPLVSGVPVSTREIDDTEVGNKIANMFVALPVQIEDPVERLRLIHESTMSAKEMTKAVRARRIQSLAESAPPAVINLAFRTMFSAQLDQLVPAAANVLVSNVPGPPFPLYSAGARVRAIYPIGPLMMGMGLNCTVMSYIDSVDFGLQCDPELIADPWAISAHIPDALRELTKAHGATTNP
jgi:WS/DGAT/MGAT family acyltransferase